MSLARRFGAARYQADEHSGRALLAFDAGDGDVALNAIEQAISLLPNEAEYHAAQGWILREARDATGAGRAFERALESDPLNLLANYAVGMRAYGAKNWAEAEAAFIKALASAPKRPEIQYYLALTRHRLGDNRKALEWMSAARGGFARSSDEREEYCLAWMREFEKLLAENGDLSDCR